MNMAVSGLRAWLVQRVSAIYLAGFILFLAAHFLIDPPDSWQAWRDWVATPVITLAWGLGFVALLLHAWVGIRDVIMDYLHHTMVRFLALSAVGTVLIVMVLWTVRILDGVSV